MRFYSHCMNELDDVWSQMLAEAGENARSSGRHNVAEYLHLKATNDQIRERSVRWLFDSIIEIAANSNRRNPTIEIEREEPHNFTFRGANMVGSLLRVRQGVRCLTLEAGWTRTPADGFMRGGALAVARISHFGITKANADLRLLSVGKLPEWLVVRDEISGETLDLAALQRHFDIFLGE